MKKSGVCENRVGFGDGPTVPFKRLILRAVLRQVSPMVIRLLSIPDDMNFPVFHEVTLDVLGWNGDLGYIIRVHGQEFRQLPPEDAVASVA
jgi:hypothetical protein